MSEPAWVPLGAPGIPQTIFPIDFRNPAMASNPGNAYPGVNALSGWEEWAWNFIDSATGSLYGIVRVPETALVTAPKIILELASLNAGNVVLSNGIKRIAAGAALAVTAWDQIFGGTVAMTAGRVRQPTSYTLSGAGIPVAGDLCVITIARDAANAADTLVGNLELLGGYLSLV